MLLWGAESLRLGESHDDWLMVVDRSSIIVF